MPGARLQAPHFESSSPGLCSAPAGEHVTKRQAAGNSSQGDRSRRLPGFQYHQQPAKVRSTCAHLSGCQDRPPCCAVTPKSQSNLPRGHQSNVERARLPSRPVMPNAVLNRTSDGAESQVQDFAPSIKRTPSSEAALRAADRSKAGVRTSAQRPSNRNRSRSASSDRRRGEGPRWLPGTDRIEELPNETEDEYRPLEPGRTPTDARSGKTDISRRARSV